MLDAFPAVKRPDAPRVPSLRAADAEGRTALRRSRRRSRKRPLRRYQMTL